MASPDFSAYVDLTVYDEQPINIYNRALEYARIALPEWTPVPGSVEDALLQSVAQMTGFAAAAINRLPNSMAQILLQLFDVERYGGTPATATAVITFVDDNVEHTVPAGTRVGYSLVEGDSTRFYLFETTNLVSGTESVNVSLQGTVLTEYPALPGGTTLRLITPVSFISTVTLVGDLVTGSGPEADSDYLQRAIGRLSSYSSALVLPSQFDAYVLSTYSEVTRCKAYSRVNPANSGLDDAPENGYLTMYACGPSGVALDSELIALIRADIEARAVAGLTISIEAPRIVDFEVEVAYTIVPGFLYTVVEEALAASLNTFLHPDYWNWDTTIHYNDLVSRLAAIPGVDHIVSIDIGNDGGANTSGWEDLDWTFTEFGSLPNIPEMSLGFSAVL